ncbi:hypothetical protein [Proteiniclasticum sediminis]|nr:hypothetical protein [Proteiniclasticum sediminis]
MTASQDAVFLCLWRGTAASGSQEKALGFNGFEKDEESLVLLN